MTVLPPGSSGEPGDYFYGAHDSEGGEQRTLSIKDGNTFVTDDELKENTTLSISDPALARDVKALYLDPDQGLFTEEEVLGRNQHGEEDDGLDPVPVA